LDCGMMIAERETWNLKLKTAETVRHSVNISQYLAQVVIYLFGHFPYLLH